MAKDTCSVEECGRAAICRGWCAKHYNRFLQKGDPIAPYKDNRGRRGLGLSICRIDACTKPVNNGGRCSKHHKFWVAHGFDGGRPQRPAVCIIEGCGRRHSGEGLCSAHRRRFLKTGVVGGPIAIRTPGGNPSHPQYREKSAPRPRPSVCDVCGDPPNREQGAAGQIHFDHDHATGTFRGWLCSPCNLALGMVRDDPRRLRALADYLEHATEQVRNYDKPSGHFDG